MIAAVETVQDRSQRSLQERERNAQRWWLGGITLFFAVQIVIWAVAITLTHRDPSHAVIPGYDHAALHWDEQRAGLAASRALGWTAEIRTEPVANRPGQSQVLIRLTDRAGDPVAGAQARFVLFHCARAAVRTETGCTEIEPGLYAAGAIMDRPGLWQIEFEAVRGEAHFVDRQRIELDRAALGLPANRYLDERRSQ